MKKAEQLILSIASVLETDLSASHNFLAKHDTLSSEAKPQAERASKNTKAALATYTNKGYTYINSTLRGLQSTHPSHGKPNTFKKIEHLKQLTRNTTEHSFRAYRGLKKNIHGKIAEGDLIHDHGFTSASISPHTANTFNKGAGEKFIINIKPGTKGYYAGHDESLENVHEREFILHPGTKFKVGHTETDNEGKKWTHLTIHSQED